MPFIFPKRVLQNGDVLAKADMNADWQPIGELASGGLDSHNLAGALASQVTVADSTFHKAYYILDELLIAGQQQETSKNTVNMLHIRYPRTTSVQHRCCSGCAITCVCRAY